MSSEYDYKNTGKLAVNLNSNRVCMIIKENKKTGQIQTVENIQPLVINTHDSWNTLVLKEEN